MSRRVKVISVVAGLLAGVILAGWLGLQKSPKSFPAFPRQPIKPRSMRLPDGLPHPVERFYRQIYGENVPVVESAVITGRAKLRVAGITLRGRFRFTHDAGHGYRHYIEATIFGFPVFRINEHYLEGKARLEIAFRGDPGRPQNQPGRQPGLNPYGCRQSLSRTHASTGSLSTREQRSFWCHSMETRSI